MNETAKTPAHLWIVGILSLVWNSIGPVDYVMTRQRNAAWIESMMPGADPNAVFAYVDAFPLWTQAAWGFGVWGALLGSILLLARSRWAVLSFGISLAGAVVSLGYQVMRGPPPGVPNEGFAALMPYVIILIAALLFCYSWRQRGNGVLR
jgi:hypothetical protein